MRIVYAALDQRVPGTTGGSIHVTAVADGLAALGHDIDVLTTPGAGPFPAGPARWHALAPPLGLRHLRVLRTEAVRTFADQARAASGDSNSSRTVWVAGHSPSRTSGDRSTARGIGPPPMAAFGGSCGCRRRSRKPSANGSRSRRNGAAIQVCWIRSPRRRTRRTRKSWWNICKKSSTLP